MARVAGQRDALVACYLLWPAPQVTRVTQYAAKLLLKPDQNQMVQLCCHLFWTSDTKVSAVSAITVN